MSESSRSRRRSTAPCLSVMPSFARTFSLVSRFVGIGVVRLVDDDVHVGEGVFQVSPGLDVVLGDAVGVLVGDRLHARVGAVRELIRGDVELPEAVPVRIVGFVDPGALLLGLLERRVHIRGVLGDSLGRVVGRLLALEGDVGAALLVEEGGDVLDPLGAAERGVVRGRIEDDVFVAAAGAGVIRDPSPRVDGVVALGLVGPSGGVGGTRALAEDRARLLGVPDARRVDVLGIGNLDLVEEVELLEERHRRVWTIRRRRP